jgi:hypothetical protein
VSAQDRAALKAIVRAPTSEQRAVSRARVVLRSAEGTAIEPIAVGTGVALAKIARSRSPSDFVPPVQPPVGNV